MSYKDIIRAALLVFVVTFSVYKVETHPHDVIAQRIVEEDTDENINNSNQAAAAALAVQATKVKYQVSTSTPQFVVISFDGSKSVDFLNETLDFERSMNAKNKPIRFTYFINAAYFITKDNSQLYKAPGQNRGLSKIGFSSTTQDVADRVRAFNTAFSMGNEVGSHSVGHFDGSNWSSNDWKQEFMSFTSLMAAIQQNNPGILIDQPLFTGSVRGFRAPFLGPDRALYRTLNDFGFLYDSSGNGGQMDIWPSKDEFGIWHIPMGIVFVGSNRSPIIAMDYNLYSHQSGAKDTAVRGTSAWNKDFDEVESAYIEYFNTNYKGNRAPIIIGAHFSKWNDGVYWESLKTFADFACGQPQVKCVTFKELVDYLNTNGVPPVVK